MPNTESDKSIDDLLDSFQNWNGIGDPEVAYARAKATAKDQIYSLLMDVIGENELEHPILEAQAGARTRNRLRAEQRQKLKELFGKEK